MISISNTVRVKNNNISTLTEKSVNTKRKAINAIVKKQPHLPISSRSSKSENIKTARVYSPSAIYQDGDNKDMLVSIRKGGYEIGQGFPESPFKQVIRKNVNQSGCYYCPTEYCDCENIADLLEDTFNSLIMRRITTVTGKRHMCAKSIETNFVSRLIRVLNIKKDDVFYDLGSGNGSVLFQVAYMTGAKCIGVELCPHNSELSRQAWSIIQPKLTQMKKKEMPDLKIITGDLTEIISKADFAPTGKTVIWASNLLMPKSLTSYMADIFRNIPIGSRIACLDDLYPHTRAVARTMDPEVFELFHMEDYQWPCGAVEWTNNVGIFYVHKRK